MIYPVTDYFNSSHSSYTENAEGYGLTAADMQWFWGQYLKSEAEAQDTYASPLRAKDFHGLPAALIITAEYDVLRDEGEQYGKRLAEAGVATKVIRYDGMNHGFFSMCGLVDKTKQALEDSASWLNQRFA